MEKKIPRCMSTQHPDNVTVPFFAEGSELSGEDEVQEAYYSFSHLGCDEQMWDCEGKEVDSFVVKKLLTKYPEYFQQKGKILGSDLFITLRVPNPDVERAEAKILLETLESIPRSFDAAQLFYQKEQTPIFEVIVPMATSAEGIDNVYQYYTNFVAGKQHALLKRGGKKIADWIGTFQPEKINVIPLFEDKETLLTVDTITKKYLEGKDLAYQRIFLARSDPAMNYGLLSAVLLNKIALQRLHGLAKQSGIPIYPIVGIGSAPFRGNLTPHTISRVTNEYPSSHTFTIQSAFKYDHDPDDIKQGIHQLSHRNTKRPQSIDEERCQSIIESTSAAFRKQVIALAPIINKISQYVPGRRKRKLHIGLFGYSREVEGISLPRAIQFTAALYSIGLPPELLGLNALQKEDMQFLKNTYVNFEGDLKDSLQYFNPRCIDLLPEPLRPALKTFPVSYTTNKHHKRITDDIITALRRNKNEILSESIIQAANIRKFLG